MEYEQLSDGRWQKVRVPDEYKPQAVRCWYMRDNHTFRPLPLDVDGALTVLREERDAGQTYGMLCAHPGGLVDVVHASNAERWPAFEDAARPWLEKVVALSKPPNVRAKRETPHDQA